MSYQEREIRLLTFSQLKTHRRHPYSRVHTGRLVRAGLFPAPIQVGPGRIAWIESEIDAHYESLAAARLPKSGECATSGNADDLGIAAPPATKGRRRA